MDWNPENVSSGGVIIDAPPSVGQCVQEGLVAHLVVVVCLAMWVENRWVGVPVIAQGRVRGDAVANCRMLAPFFVFRRVWRAVRKVDVT